jgi:hypothetical protein
MIRPATLKKRPVRQEISPVHRIAAVNSEGTGDIVARFFDQEALEGAEETTAGSEEEEDIDTQAKENKFDDYQGKWAGKQSKTRKICRHFSSDLLVRAVRYEWEPEQIADLVLLVAKEMNLDSPQILRMIRKKRIACPRLLSYLSDRLDLGLSLSDVTSAFLVSAGSMPAFIAMVEEALEMELIRLDSPDSINEVSLICLIFLARS